MITTTLMTWDFWQDAMNTVGNQLYGIIIIWDNDRNKLATPAAQPILSTKT